MAFVPRVKLASIADVEYFVDGSYNDLHLVPSSFVEDVVNLTCTSAVVNIASVNNMATIQMDVISLCRAVEA